MTNETDIALKKSFNAVTGAFAAFEELGMHFSNSELFKFKALAENELINSVEQNALIKDRIQFAKNIIELVDGKLPPLNLELLGSYLRLFEKYVETANEMHKMLASQDEFKEFRPLYIKFIELVKQCFNKCSFRGLYNLIPETRDINGDLLYIPAPSQEISPPRLELG